MPRDTNESSIKLIWENNPDTPLTSSALSKSLDFIASYKNYNTDYSPGVHGEFTLLTIDPNDATQLLFKRGSIIQIINEAEDAGTPLIPENQQYRMFDVGLDDIIITSEDTDETLPTKTTWTDAYWFVYICDRDDSAIYGEESGDGYGGGAQIIISKRNNYPVNIQVPGRPSDTYTEKDTRIIGGFQTNAGNIIANSIWDIAGYSDTVKTKNGYYVLNPYTTGTSYSFRQIDLRDLNTDRSNIIDGTLTINDDTIINGDTTISGDIQLNSDEFNIDSSNGYIHYEDDGSSVLLEINAPTTLSETITCNGTVTIQNEITHTGNYGITGDITQTGDLSVTGSTTLTGSLSQSSGNVSFGGSGATITTAGTWSHSGSIDITGNPIITGSTTLNGTVVATANSITLKNIADDLSVVVDNSSDKIILTGDVEISGDVYSHNGTVSLQSNGDIITSVPGGNTFKHSQGSFIVDNADFTVQQNNSTPVVNIDTSEKITTFYGDIVGILDTGNTFTLETPSSDPIFTVEEDNAILEGNMTVRNDLTVDGTINATISGSSSEATKWSNTLTLHFTDDMTGDVTFDGSEGTLNVSLTAGSTMYTKSDLDGGQLDDRYYTEDEINPLDVFSNPIWSPATPLDKRYYTKNGLDTGQLDGRYYNRTDADNEFYPRVDIIPSSSGPGIASDSDDMDWTGTEIDLRYYTKVALNPNTTGDGIGSGIDIGAAGDGALDDRYYTETEIVTNYYTKTNLETEGEAIVHWGNISFIPYGQRGSSEFISRNDHTHSINFIDAATEEYLFDLHNEEVDWDFSSSLMDISVGDLQSEIQFLSDDPLEYQGVYFILYYNDGVSTIEFWFQNSGTPAAAPDGTSTLDQIIDITGLTTVTDIRDTVIAAISGLTAPSPNPFNATDIDDDIMSITYTDLTTFGDPDDYVPTSSDDGVVDAYRSYYGSLHFDLESNVYSKSEIDTNYYTQSDLQTSGSAEVHWGNITTKPTEFAPTDHDNTAHSAVYIEATDVTYNNLNNNGDVGTSANQVAAGDHDHDSDYYTETETDSLLAGKSDTSHTHHDLYYQESELNPGTSSGLATDVTNVTWGTTGTQDLSGVLINDAGGTTTSNKNDASETDTRYYTKEDVAIIIDNVLRNVAQQIYNAASSLDLTFTNPINGSGINKDGYA